MNDTIVVLRGTVSCFFLYMNFLPLTYALFWSPPHLCYGGDRRVSTRSSPETNDLQLMGRSAGFIAAFGELSFKIYRFNREARPREQGRAGRWFARGRR